MSVLSTPPEEALIPSLLHCPICKAPVRSAHINQHIDSSCQEHIISEAELDPKKAYADIFNASREKPRNKPPKAPAIPKASYNTPAKASQSLNPSFKRSFESPTEVSANGKADSPINEPLSKRSKPSVNKNAPLAERMRPQTLDDVLGQTLVGPTGLLRSLIESDRTPSMILWGGAGSGKTTIARAIAHVSGARFVEINATTSGVAELKKIFAEANGDLSLTGRRTVIFCDEIHRFSKSQQDVFLGPVESGQVTLIGATTENPSFKVQNALLSRCRTFTLAKLSDDAVTLILQRALKSECPESPPPLLTPDYLSYLAGFAAGDARTALNLLELSISLTSDNLDLSLSALKSSLTQSLVYDRAGDQHYDTISAFHKSIRGSDPDAALYYLARMLQSGEDPLYIARRLIVIASEDIGLADNSMLSLATATYTACEKLGMPEVKINLAHATVAMALSKKSTRAYRGLSAVMHELEEPGIAGLPIPVHLRNAPTRLMKELGYGAEYRYNPEFQDGKVYGQEYLPEELRDKRWLENRDFGDKFDVVGEELRRAGG